MSRFDDFFRANYRGMVNYCSAFGYRDVDAEEEVADVILRHYDEYMSRVEGPNPHATVRHWMNRRVLLNLKSRSIRFYNLKTVPLPDDHDTLDFNDPADVADLKQRIPQRVPDILFSYEQYSGSASAKGENTNADRSKFCRERKRFLISLQGPSL